MASKTAIIGIGIAVVAIAVIAALVFPVIGGRTLSQLATDPQGNATAPDTVSNQELTTVKSVREEYTYTTRASLLSDTFVLQGGVERTVKFSTAPADSALLVGNATVTGGSVNIKHVNSEGNCTNVSGCEQVTIKAQSEPGSFYNADGVKPVEMRIIAGQEQALIFSSSRGSTITFSFDVIYTETGTRTPNDEVKASEEKQDSLFNLDKN